MRERIVRLMDEVGACEQSDASFIPFVVVSAGNDDHRPHPRSHLRASLETGTDRRRYIVRK